MTIQVVVVRIRWETIEMNKNPFFLTLINYHNLGQYYKMIDIVVCFMTFEWQLFNNICSKHVAIFDMCVLSVLVSSLRDIETTEE